MTALDADLEMMFLRKSRQRSREQSAKQRRGNHTHDHNQNSLAGNGARYRRFEKTLLDQRHQRQENRETERRPPELARRIDAGSLRGEPHPQQRCQPQGRRHDK